MSSHINNRVPGSSWQWLAALLVHYRLSKPKQVVHFLDDQDYNTDFHFTDEQQRTFKIVIWKSSKA